MNIICVGNTILAAAEESGIGENWCLANNQSTCKALISGKYLSNIRYAPDGKYLRFHWNTGLTYKNKIGNLPRYSDPVWYNIKDISNILLLGLLQKHHIVTYNSKYGNAFVVHIPQQPTFNMTKDGIFYHNMRHILKNKKNAHICQEYQSHGWFHKPWKDWIVQSRTCGSNMWKT